MDRKGYYVVPMSCKEWYMKLYKHARSKINICNGQSGLFCVIGILKINSISNFINMLEVKVTLLWSKKAVVGDWCF